MTALAYADDLALVAADPNSMGRLLRAAEVSAGVLGLSFNPRECATLNLGAKGQPISTPFQLAGEHLPVLEHGDSYFHLGVPTGVGIDQTPYSAVVQLSADVRAISASLLASWQKFEAVATFLLPRLNFLFRGEKVKKTPLNEAHRILRRTIKSCLNLPQRSRSELVFIPPSFGGCRLPPLADLADVTTVAHAFRILNADDPVIARLARSALVEAVRRKIRREPNGGYNAGYLSGSEDVDLALPSTSCVLVAGPGCRGQNRE